MAWKPDYTSLALLHAQLRVTDTTDDAAMSAAITAASRAVDYECDRQFGSAVQTRYYTFDEHLVIDGRFAVKIDDVQTTTGLVVAYDSNDDGTWSQATTLGTDWVLWPYNAPSDGRPWTHLLQKSTALYPFPCSRQGVKVTATFGWTAVPDVVAGACLILASQIFARRDAAFRATGSATLGNDSVFGVGVDPEVAAMLRTVKRRWGAV